MTSMTAGAMIIIALAVFVGGYIQTAVGFGAGLFAAPLIALVAPQLLPGLILLLACVTSGIALVSEWRAVDFRGASWLLAARLPGTVVGVWLVAWMSHRDLARLVGVTVLLAVAVSLLQVMPPITWRSQSVAGFLAGIFGTATSIGGPPVALLYQRRPVAEFRATLSAFFVVGSVISLAGLGTAGELTREQFVAAALLAPGMLASSWVGLRTRHLIPTRTFRIVVLSVCTLSALALLIGA